jgi:hypothetical protein
MSQLCGAVRKCRLRCECDSSILNHLAVRCCIAIASDPQLRYMQQGVELDEKPTPGRAEPARCTTREVQGSIKLLR